MPSLDRTRLSQQPRNRLTKRHPRLPTAGYALILLVRKARDDRVERALVGRVVAGGVDAGECRHVEQRTAAASPPMVSIVHHKQVSGSKPSVLQGTPADVVSKHARRPGQARPGQARPGQARPGPDRARSSRSEDVSQPGLTHRSCSPKPSEGTTSPEPKPS